MDLGRVWACVPSCKDVLAIKTDGIDLQKNHHFMILDFWTQMCWSSVLGLYKTLVSCHHNVMKHTPWREWHWGWSMSYIYYIVRLLFCKSMMKLLIVCVYPTPFVGGKNHVRGQKYCLAFCAAYICHLKCKMSHGAHGWNIYLWNILNKSVDGSQRERTDSEPLLHVNKLVCCAASGGVNLSRLCSCVTGKNTLRTLSCLSGTQLTALKPYFS